MDVELLARIQFGITAGFHFLFPPMSIGLGVILVIMEWRFLRTKNMLYERMAKFWTKVFALTFGVGVATGIVMEFEFGTNWATYSRYVGDIFGSPLTAEAIFAFFLESTFLGILIFGWNRVSPKMHFFSTCMVALGATLSAFWIIVANSWMQTPAGFHIVNEGGIMRAEITDFWAMVFNPSTIERFSHVISASWLTGAFLVMSVAAYYLVKRRHIDFAKSSMRIALFLATLAAFLQLETGHRSAMEVVKYQPEKLATFEGHFNTAVLDLYFIGYLDVENERIIGLKWPGFLSWLIYGDFSAPVKGRNDFPKDELPPIQLPFQTYHIMVAIGMAFIGIVLFSIFLLWRKKLFETKWYLKLLIPAFALPHIANLCGWIAAEVGRQPWAVYKILRTDDAISKVVASSEVWFSLILFTTIYIVLSILFVFLLLKKIKHGPEEFEPLTM
ncbi:cytochrome ubiquinol oxidase subunit I [Bacteroidetes/Chlorobi group bacterium ChocPot_Mid]|nr:MAG: cytochrome ubiquinol oxidase subunit I [Bacteroidetes/Chlorobi group bacterium ChocPot_Mid]